MSMEALDAIALAEEKARQTKTAAQQDAARSVEQARLLGEAALAAAEAKAADETRELLRRSDEKAKEDAAVLASNTRNRRAAMKARADKKQQDAVSFVLERIVNG